MADLIERMKGFVTTMTERPQSVKRWPLHLKHTTPLDMRAVLRLTTTRRETREFLLRVQCFLASGHFDGLRTSRTIKTCALTREEIERAVAMGKFEPVPEDEIFPGRNSTQAEHQLPPQFHGVNVFTVAELKGRRRLITEPLLNRVIPKHLVPKVHYETRLGRRQQLRYSKYMLQIDFEAYYDAIPLEDVALRNRFVFRAKHDKKYYRLRTLPTGARWSVAVGQAVTWAIVDVPTPVTVLTLIDNILIAAHEGQEREFVSCVRRVLDRIRAANLLTSPDREELAGMSDAEMLDLAVQNNVFLGEEYMWNGHERLVRNSIKTVAKMQLALAKKSFTIRSLASLISLILFALHTTQMNPATAFKLLRAYRGIYRLVYTTHKWDDDVPYLDTEMVRRMHEIGRALVRNEWNCISNVRHITNQEADYDAVCFTDASLEGWGAVVRLHCRGSVSPPSAWTYRQMWVDDLAHNDNNDGRSPEAILSTLRERMKENQHRYRLAGRVLPDSWRRTGVTSAIGVDHHVPGYRDEADSFHAKHSAHAEPRAAQLLLRQLMDVHKMPDGSRIALVTDHRAIVVAQKHLNGFGGIGRGFTLNKLYEYAYDLWYERNIDVVFFYVAGPENPADALSRNFGVSEEETSGCLIVQQEPQHALTGVPFLRSTWCPLLEPKAHWEESAE